LLQVGMSMRKLKTLAKKLIQSIGLRRRNRIE